MAAAGFTRVGPGFCKRGAGLPCSPSAVGGRRRGAHQSAGRSQPPAVPGRVRKAAEPGPAAAASPSSAPGPAEAADTKSYLWARYHEMKKLVYGKSRAAASRASPVAAAPRPALVPLLS